jgi:hypothetical protein
LRDLDSGPSQSAQSFLEHCIEAHLVCLFLLFKLRSLLCLRSSRFLFYCLFMFLINQGLILLQWLSRGCRVHVEIH